MAMTAHMMRKGSILSKPQCSTRSALDKNLNASPSSRNPITTLTVLSQEPDLGNLFMKEGNAANKVNGSASARPNPPIPSVNWVAPPSELKDPARSEPRIGPVQENETSASVNAIKNIPTNQPTPAALHTLLLQEPRTVK